MVACRQCARRERRGPFSLAFVWLHSLACVCAICPSGLPLHLPMQSAFRPTCVVLPDATVVLAARLVSEGFASLRAAGLARKLAWLFSSIQNTLTIPRVLVPTPLHTAAAVHVDNRLELGDSRYPVAVPRAPCTPFTPLLTNRFAAACFGRFFSFPAWVIAYP
jgi:hypothetical protein